MHRSFGFFAFRKIKLLQKFFHIHRLMNKGSIRSLVDLNSEEVLEFSHHAHFKLILHRLSKLVSKCSTRCSKDDIINIYLTNYNILFKGFTKESSVHFSSSEIIFQKERT